MKHTISLGHKCDFHSHFVSPTLHLVFQLDDYKLVTLITEIMEDKKKVIIFDWDGTLVNSQPFQYSSCRQAFASHGYSLTEKDWEEWVKHSYSSKRFIEERNLPFDYKSIKSEKKVIYQNMLLNEVQFMDGAVETINSLTKIYPLGIASHSTIDDIELVLNKFDMRDRFMKLVSDTSVERGKPFPDVFLKTAELMGVSPIECLVIEDSVAGLQAAKSAGMKCIICPDKYINTPLSEFTNADYVVGNLREVTKFI